MARIPVVRLASPVGSSNPNGATIAATLPMQGPALPREQFSMRAMNRTQSAQRSATVQATSSDDANCTLFRAISFTANVTQLLPHGLARVWTGCRFETPQIAFARFICAHVSPAQDASFIAVTSDVNCIADVRVW